MAQPSSDPTDSIRSYLCSDMKGPNCTSDAIEQASLLMPLCADAQSRFCVKSFSLTLADGSKYTSHLLSGFNQPESQALPERGLPAGSTGQLWSAPESLKDQGVDGFYIAVREEFFTLPTLGDNKFKSWHTTAVVAPYREIVSSSALTPQFQTGRDNSTGKLHIFFYPAAGYCAALPGNPLNIWQAEHRCGYMSSFPDGVRPELSFRDLPNSSNWFNARLDDPQITSASSSDYRDVTVSGLPVTIPTVSYGGNLDEEVKTAFSTAFGPLFDGTSYNWLIPSNHALALKQLSPFLKVGKDTATSSLQAWSLSSVSPNTIVGPLYRCVTSTSGVAGIVSMNSTVYDAGTPALEDGSLNFHVAAPHYAADGTTPNEGSYTLLMNDDVARCIYGFSKGPVQAKVSVWASDGTEKTATTIVSDKDGWLKLTARGFTYSSPTIKATLTQPTPTATPSPAPTQSSNAADAAPPVTQKLMRITCTKGKLTKKVTAVSPKCPAGYKKKA